MSVVIRYIAHDVETLADWLSQGLCGVRADPFLTDVVITGSVGLQRWLAQRLSLTLGASDRGDGVCAGVTMTTPERLSRLISGDDDPWSSNALVDRVWHALGAVSDLPSFAPYRSYLFNPRRGPSRTDAWVAQVARRLAAYVGSRGELLQSWQTTTPPESDPTAWQAQLWKTICDQAGSTPEDTAATLRLRAADAAKRFASVTLFCPDPIRPIDLDLLTAIDQVRPITALHLATTEPGDPPAHLSQPDSVGQQLGQRRAQTVRSLTQLAHQHIELTDRRPTTSLLSRLQADLRGASAEPGGDDESISLHVVGPDRQADQVAELLASLLDADPSLQPRDIIVATHRLDQLRPSLAALLHSDDSPLATARHRIRAALTDVDPPADGWIDLLGHILRLLRERASADDLVNLCRHPAVMRRSGLTATDVSRLAAMVEASGMRWGVNAPGRAKDQMDQFPHNTWATGLARLVLGVALDEDDLTWRGAVLPLNAADSDSVRLVEILGHLIGQVRAAQDLWHQQADQATWSDRFRHTMTQLLGEHSASPQADAALARFAQGSPHLLTADQAERRLSRIWATSVHVSAFGNGDLAVTDLGSMALVPARVVIVAGLDVDTFPASTPLDIDDVADVWSEPEFDVRLRDYQGLWDAIQSARDKLILVCRGFDATGGPVPLPKPIHDLEQVCRALSSTRCDVRRDHPPRGPASPSTTGRSQEQSWPKDPASIGQTPPNQRLAWESANLDTDPIHSGATAFDAEPSNTQAARFNNRGTAVRIDDMAGLFAQPAAHWLKRHANLTVSALKPAEPLPDAITIDLSALDRWKVVDTMLRLLGVGQRADDIVEAELRRGLLPPGPAGVLAARQCLQVAQSIFTRTQPLRNEDSQWLPIWVDTAADVTLTGDVEVFGSDLVESHAGLIRCETQMAAWIRLLTTQICHPQHTRRAHIIGRRNTVVLTAPDPGRCLTIVNELARVYRAALSTPWFAPPAVAGHVASMASRGLPFDPTVVRRLIQTQWERDPSWALIWSDPRTVTGLADPIGGLSNPLRPVSSTPTATGSPNQGWSPLNSSDDQTRIDRWVQTMCRAYQPMMEAGGVP
ncbi:MAG: exodeoxyribonuclease V subunit gamma [Propionibacteriaceae bacterium]|nr:exodeoxyribonuclease V subunit gamma [Propionibacteriaceae bacterium]